MKRLLLVCLFPVMSLHAIFCDKLIVNPMLDSKYFYSYSPLVGSLSELSITPELYMKYNNFFIDYKVPFFYDNIYDTSQEFLAKRIRLGDMFVSFGYSIPIKQFTHSVITGIAFKSDYLIAKDGNQKLFSDSSDSSIEHNIYYLMYRFDYLNDPILVKNTISIGAYLFNTDVISEYRYSDTIELYFFVCDDITLTSSIVCNITKQSKQFIGTYGFDYKILKLHITPCLSTSYSGALTYIYPSLSIMYDF